MAISTSIGHWLDAERTADADGRREARNALTTALWVTYQPILYRLAGLLSPRQRSDIVNSGFLKFVEQLERGAIRATTRKELFAVLKRNIRDKFSERARTEVRRRKLMPVQEENELLRGAEGGSGPAGSGVDGIAQWATSPEAPPEFRAIISDMLDAVPKAELREILLLKLEDLNRTKVDIAQLLGFGVSDKKIGRAIDEITKLLAAKWDWFREEADRRRRSPRRAAPPEPAPGAGDG